jgi:hypothetical protein
MLFREFVLTLASMACLSVATAQQITHRPILTGLVLEVTYLKGASPAYQSVPWADAKIEGDWYARYGRITGWQLPAGTLPIRAVKLVPSLKGDNVTLRVSVLRGIRHDVEETVGIYHPRENERINIDALTNFGVAPFEIEVIRVAPPLPNTPSIVNETKSLDVVAIEPHISNIPGFKLTLHNLSDKNVSALTLNVVMKDRDAVTGMPQGLEGRPRIEAGGYAEFPFPLARAYRAPGSYELSNPPKQHLVISSVVFEDGSYEGDAKFAGQFLALELGRKIELKRILTVLRSALKVNEANNAEGAEGAEGADAATRLGSSIRALSFETQPADYVALFEAFPGLDQKSLDSASNAAIHGVRKQLLDELQAFQGRPRVTGQDFRSWLTATNERYANWLTRLNK